MTRAEFIVYKEFRILDLDLRGSKDIDQNIAAFQLAQNLAMKEHLKSLRILTDVTDAHYTVEGIAVVKEFSKSITPHVKASATVGITGVRKIIFQSIIKLAGRDIKLFNTRNEALKWLVEQ